MDYKRLYAIVSLHIERRLSRRHTSHTPITPLPSPSPSYRRAPIADQTQKSADGVYIGRRRLSSCLSSCYRRIYALVFALLSIVDDVTIYAVSTLPTGCPSTS